MANYKLLALLLGTGVTLSSVAHAENTVTDDELRNARSSISKIIEDISDGETNRVNGSCYNGSCTNNGSCR